MTVLRSQKEVAVITRSTYYQGGREAGFHCLEKYLQLQNTVSIICLIRGCMESLGNDDVSIVHARK